MRTGPVALAHLGDQAAIADAARRIAELTHADPLAGDSCVLWSLAKNPLQLPALIRTGRHSETAFKKLLRCRRLLGRGLRGDLGGLDL